MVLLIRPFCKTEFYFAGKSHMTLHVAPRRLASLANNKSSSTLPKLVSRHDAPPPDHRGTVNYGVVLIVIHLTLHTS